MLAHRFRRPQTAGVSGRLLCDDDHLARTAAAVLTGDRGFVEMTYRAMTYRAGAGQPLAPFSSDRSIYLSRCDNLARASGTSLRNPMLPIAPQRTADPSFVYLVPHATQPRFKLGKADQPFSRLTKVSRVNGGYALDWGRSVTLQVATAEHALQLERSLRYIPWVHNAWLEPAEHGDTADGRTEWHRIDVFERLLEYVTRNAEALGCQVCLGIRTPARTPEAAPARTPAAIVPQPPPESPRRSARSLRQEASRIRRFLDLRGADNSARRELALDSLRELMPYCVSHERNPCCHGFTFVSDVPISGVLPRWGEFRAIGFDLPQLFDGFMRPRSSFVEQASQLSIPNGQRYFSWLSLNLGQQAFNREVHRRGCRTRAERYPQYGSWLEAEALAVEAFSTALTALTPGYAGPRESALRDYRNMESRLLRLYYLERCKTGWRPDSEQSPLPPDWEHELEILEHDVVPSHEAL